MASDNLWNQFKERLIFDKESGFSLDTSRLRFDEQYLARLEPKMHEALNEMASLEAGAIANRDENRMVGHYWLRDVSRAPTEDLQKAITSTNERIRSFANSIHSGAIAPRAGSRFKHLLVVGIGGSALGPQFAYNALRSARDPMTVSFFDNTDPDGMSKNLFEIGDLSTTLVVVISKSGGTKETRNGQLVVKKAFQAAGLDYSKHFVAVTGDGSELDATAVSEGWLERFPMWDWVGGRTSECSAVGLLPLALQGADFEQMLAGAAAMDSLTRERDIRKNPAAMLALGWFHCGCGKGLKDMVILPYKDRLELFSRYLQQLVMESLGKEHDLSGAVVNQGIAVYGNKGATDQHAYVQQLRDGVHNFFVTFIQVLRDRSPKTVGVGPSASLNSEGLEVEPGITSGDYLTGFYLGTRSALFEKQRESITVTVPEVNEYYVGMLIALFERAVGLYASLIHINAYHQPGVEAGKKAAAAVLHLQSRMVAYLREASRPVGVEELAADIHAAGQEETIFTIARHLVANQRLDVVVGETIFEDRYVARRAS